MTKLKIAPLELLYQECKETTETEKQALERDLTKIFLEHLQDTITHKELITLLIRGMVRKGKSTAGLMILLIINQLLNKKTTIKNVFSDQIEWTKFVTSTELKKICVMCDEYSRAGEGSYNATTEAQLFGTYLEMFAVNYIHTIFITPSNSYNEHASIILDIIGKDEETKETHFKLLYKNKLESTTITLGRVTINVEPVLKLDFYKQYERKKQARLDLTNKHGIRDIRPCVFADLTLQTYNRLLPLATNKKIPTEVVNIAFQRIARKNVAILSIISETSITNTVRGLLNMKVVLNQKINEISEMIKKDKIIQSENAKKEYKLMENEFENLLKELKELKKVLTEYMQIEG